MQKQEKHKRQLVPDMRRDLVSDREVEACGADLRRQRKRRNYFQENNCKGEGVNKVRLLGPTSRSSRGGATGSAECTADCRNEARPSGNE